MLGTTADEAAAGNRKRRHSESTHACSAKLYLHNHDVEFAPELSRRASTSTPAAEMHQESDPVDGAVVNGLAQDFRGRCPRLTSTSRSTTKVSADVKNSIDEDSSANLLAEAYRSVLTGIGEDPDREGLLKTPERAAKAMMYFTKGYEESVAGK